MNSDRRGFVLPTSLLVLSLLTVMLTAAFIVVSAEYRSTDNSMSSTRARALAQAGLQSYFASTRNLQPTDWGDSVRYTFSGGYTDVVARKMRSATTGATPWIVRATAYTTDPLLTGQVTATRTVAQLAQLNPATLIRPRAALTSFNKTFVNGNNTVVNPLNGDNLNLSNPAGCTLPSPSSAADTAAIISWGTTAQGQYTGSTPNGGYVTWASMTTLYDSTHINWPAILAGNFSPDWVGASGLPSPGNSSWTVGYVNGDLTIPSNGGFSPRKGVLIVTGDLTMADGAFWAGMVLVGGKIIASGTLSTGNMLILGTTVTGLNCTVTGLSCPDQTFNKYTSGSNYREFRWSYCWTWAAINSLATMVPIKNTFIDNWAGY